MATKKVNIIIEEGTTIIIDDKEYNGDVEVDEKIAETLISTGKGKQWQVN